MNEAVWTRGDIAVTPNGKRVRVGRVQGDQAYVWFLRPHGKRDRVLTPVDISDLSREITDPGHDGYGPYAVDAPRVGE